MIPRWRPSAPLAVLKARAAVLAELRAYFARTGALEIDTPLLDRHGTPDPALAHFEVPEPGGRTRYLQTSPEFAMKRLLAAGSGDIYQVCHAFRREEGSPLHQEEFTLVEWYRVGRDLHGLMDDVASLLRAVGFVGTIRKATYAALCLQHAGLDPHTASTAELADCATAAGARFDSATRADRALLLDWLFGCRVLPALASETAVFVHDFPPAQAAYARHLAGPPVVAARFELIAGGVELANGFHEVTDAAEQRARFAVENARRHARGLPPMASDERLLAALAHGLPDCAGVALGLDRLLMRLLGCTDIAEVVSFAVRPDDWD